MVMKKLLTYFANHSSMAFDLLFVFFMVKILPVFNSFLNKKKKVEDWNSLNASTTIYK